MCEYCDKGNVDLIDFGDLSITQDNDSIDINTGFGTSRYKINFCWYCGKDLRIKNFEEKSFAIRCNKCGGITIVSQKKIIKFNRQELKYNNQKIRFGTSNMEETFIFCKCGNSIIEE